MNPPNAWSISRMRKIALAADNAQQVTEATVWLRRVGLDRVVGYLAGGVGAWANAGFDPDAFRYTISAREIAG